MAVIWTPAVYVEVEANSQGGALGKASGPTCRREKKSPRGWRAWDRTMAGAGEAKFCRTKRLSYL
jgi:hypothetical protein